MKLSAIKLIITYTLFVILFVLQKPVFMITHHDIYASISLSDYFEVMLNGLPLDLSLAGYLSVIPGLLLIVFQWVNSAILRRIERVYYAFVAIISALIFCLDLGLYAYWGTRLDVTPLFYFTSSPSAAMASISTFEAIGWIVTIIIISAIIYMFFCRILLRITPHRRHPITTSLGTLLLTGMLFIPIRGGFTVATMNLSAVYYSTDQRLNHAAINPMFSLMYSATHQSDFSSQFQYFEPAEADIIFSSLTDQPPTDSIPRLFTSSRPDIYLIILESFSSHLMSTLNGQCPIAKNLDNIASESILFTNFFANGYRTDRALPAILSAYPSQPTTSIMKYVSKTDNLPSFPGALKDDGYDISYYYGGDANFTNMNAFLVSSGFDYIVSDKDFPISDRLSKWGAHDHIVFNRCLDDIHSYSGDKPTLRVIQTSSSHEPFDVPFQIDGINNKRANAFAYTDQCVGDFVNSLKTSNKWNNSLLIIVPDHYGAYPKGLNDPVKRHQIPLILAGGVISEPKRIDTIASQIDIAATILYQLGLPHNQFKFSKNILNPASPHFAFFVDNAQIAMVTEDNEIAYNCDADEIVLNRGSALNANLDKAKAFVQKLYEDLDKR